MATGQSAQPELLKMPSNTYCAVYDFELLPYALGDVLTWNVKTAIECEEAACEKVDIYICHDERYPASLYQRDLVTRENHGLFFSELYGAFGTHPKLGNLFIFRSRDELVSQLARVAEKNGPSQEAVRRYLDVLARKSDQAAMVEYFTQTIRTHEQINAYAAKTGTIPLLNTSLGCEPDVAGLITRRFNGRRIVAVHTRLRRLDAGYSGRRSYERDSDALAWYEFMRAAETEFPDVLFVLLGRLQEKPLEFLRLPNAVSLRTFGLGLGHELTLIAKCNLFIGTSSGFAAMANFSKVPYFITRMTQTSCDTYQIPYGADRLPFARPKQRLIYKPESTDNLMALLREGLKDATPPFSGSGPRLDEGGDNGSWEWERAQWLAPHATTYRFYDDDEYADREIAFLLEPRIREARVALKLGDAKLVEETLQRIKAVFPRLAYRSADFLRISYEQAIAGNDHDRAAACKALLARLGTQEHGVRRIINLSKRLSKRAYPILLDAKEFWRRVRRAPGKLLHGLNTRLFSAHRSK